MSDPRPALGRPVTGTGTEVGKTITTAALVAVIRACGPSRASSRSRRPASPTTRTATCRPYAGWPGRCPPLSSSAFRTPRSRHRSPSCRGVHPADCGAREANRELAEDHPIVLVEGSGGLLVRLDERGGTLADLGTALRYKGVSAGVLLVASAGLGTLNSAALTAEALKARGLPLIGVIIGDWPADPAWPSSATSRTSRASRVRGSWGGSRWCRSPADAGVRRLGPSWLDFA